MNKRCTDWPPLSRTALQFFTAAMLSRVNVCATQRGVAGAMTPHLYCHRREVDLLQGGCEGGLNNDSSLGALQTQITNVFFVKFSGRELWVLLFVFMRTGWLIVKTVLIPGIMEKCWLLKITLKWKMVFCSNDIRIETMHD